MASRASSIARTYRGFRDGESEATREVRGWVEVVVRGGNWRFDDEEAREAMFATIHH